MENKTEANARNPGDAVPRSISQGIHSRFQIPNEHELKVTCTPDEHGLASQPVPVLGFI